MPVASLHCSASVSYERAMPRSWTENQARLIFPGATMIQCHAWTHHCNAASWSSSTLQIPVCLHQCEAACVMDSGECSWNPSGPVCFTFIVASNAKMDRESVYIYICWSNSVIQPHSWRNYCNGAWAPLCLKAVSNGKILDIILGYRDVWWHTWAPVCFSFKAAGIGMILDRIWGYSDIWCHHWAPLYFTFIVVSILAMHANRLILAFMHPSAFTPHDPWRSG